MVILTVIPESMMRVVANLAYELLECELSMNFIVQILYQLRLHEAIDR